MNSLKLESLFFNMCDSFYLILFPISLICFSLIHLLSTSYWWQLENQSLIPFPRQILSTCWRPHPPPPLSISPSLAKCQSSPLASCQPLRTVSLPMQSPKPLGTLTRHEWLAKSTPNIPILPYPLIPLPSLSFSSPLSFAHRLIALFRGFVIVIRLATTLPHKCQHHKPIFTKFSNLFSWI